MVYGISFLRIKFDLYYLFWRIKETFYYQLQSIIKITAGILLEMGQNNYRKSSIRSRPLIQVYSIRGRAIGGSVQALIIGKSLNPSKLPYLDLY